MRKLIIQLLVVVVLIVGAAAAWYFLMSQEADMRRTGAPSEGFPPPPVVVAKARLGPVVERIAAVGTARARGGFRRTPEYQVLLADVARVERGVEDDRTILRAGGRDAIGIGIVRQSQANVIGVSDLVRAEVERIRDALPEGLAISVSYDESIFVREAVKEVVSALGQAIALVIFVIFVFLRSFRATLVPSVTIPVAIIGSFTVMAALGFSINVLTLLALILAVGLVVDDAIVMVENIQRRIEEGEPPLLAAFNGARQVAFAVIATTLALIAVFLPLSFMQGNVGRLFSEFGLTLAAAVAFS